jgi:hypothetical protein
MLRCGGFARAVVLVVAGVPIAVASACSSAPADDAAIPLPERVPEPDAGDSASTQDAVAPDAPVDGASAACMNGKKDGAETDVDCGGPTCKPCANGRACVANRDCAAAVCAGSTCSGDVGCSDATREGYTPAATYPNIAACAGAWSIPGLQPPTTKTPACSRGSGNSGVNATGAGCNVSDLCQGGWHVCESSAEVLQKSNGAGCAPAATPGLFFATRQSGAGGATCGPGANDLFGCGGVGAAPAPGACVPLDRFSNDLCSALPAGWSCGLDAFQEANNVTHTNGNDGGVLCCRD